MPQYDNTDEQETSDTKSTGDASLYWDSKNSGDGLNDDPESRVSSKSSGRSMARLELDQVPDKR